MLGSLLVVFVCVSARFMDVNKSLEGLRSNGGDAREKRRLRQQGANNSNVQIGNLETRHPIFELNQDSTKCINGKFTRLLVAVDLSPMTFRELRMGSLLH